MSTKVSTSRLGGPRDWIAGMVLLVALVVAVHWMLGWPELLAPWRSLSWSTLGELLLLTAISYGLRAVRVYDLFRDRVRGRFLSVLRLSVLHTTANNVLPMRLGELAFPWLMGRYFGEGFVAASASLVWIRLLDLHFLALVGLGILFLRDPAWWWPATALIWLGGLGWIPWFRQRFSGLSSGGRLRRLLATAAQGAPVSMWMVVRLYLWTLISWSAKLIAFATLLRHFVDLPLWRALIGATGAELSSVLPFHGIAGSGSYELAAVAALVPFGVAASDALSAAVNLHLFVLGATLVFAVAVLLLPGPRPGSRA